MINIPGNNRDVVTPRGLVVKHGPVDAIEVLIATDGEVGVIEFQRLREDVLDSLTVRLAGQTLYHMCEQGKSTVGVDGLFVWGNGGRASGEEIIVELLRRDVLGRL